METHSPRHLVLRQTLNAIRAVDGTRNDAVRQPNPFSQLSTGEEQIFSFYEPNLKGGRYKVTTEQTITAPNEPFSKTTHPVDYETGVTSQEFYVNAPKFDLPRDAVHSLYPPQGYAAPVETLPHIVFNDPHLPWLREGSSRWDDQRGKSPWLALLVFTEEELQIPQDQLDSMFAGASSVKKPVQQDGNGTIEIKISELHQIHNVETPNKDVSEQHVQSVFLKTDLFLELVRKYDNGKPTDQDFADVSRYKFLAHIRNINTTGMAEAGTQDLGLFSVILSHRVGPLNIHKPTPVVVHLLSLEDVEKTKWPVTSDKQYVALPSLYSWTYTTLPEGSFNLSTALGHLGDNLGMLRVDTEALDALAASNKDEKSRRLIDRLHDGYTLVRHRVQTGEVTSAVFRGALTPTVVDHSDDHKLRPQSNAGTDLQIFDDKLGLMDLTYSTAWQLGKTLALADQGFCTSLARVRIIVQKFAVSAAKVQHQIAFDAYSDLEGTLAALPKSIDALDSLQKSPATTEPASLLNRWKRATVTSSDLSLNNPFIVEKFEDSTGPIVKTLASSAGPQASFDAASETVGAASQPSEDPLYNELNKPYSTDWQIILSWIIDRMYLVNIPAQYLIVDPSYLPKESLRFFHIDQNWIDALIDGALSIGNTLEEHTDTIRARLKEAMNRYLTTEIPKIKRKPQVPTYGMLMRSDVVSQFPDLRVSAPRLLADGEDPSTAPATILRHENIDNEVMLCLFDRLPMEAGLFSLHFTQPPHQQTFIAGKELDSHHITVSFKRMYTSTDTTPERSKPLGDDLSLPNNETTNIPSGNPPSPQVSDPVFAWGSEQQIRTLIVPNYLKAISKRLHDVMPRDQCSEEGTVPTSAMLAIQLNNPIYELNIDFKPMKNDLHVSKLRTLRMMLPWAGKKSVSPPLTKEIVAPNAFVGLPPPEQRTTSGPLQVAPPNFKVPRMMSKSETADMRLQMQQAHNETVASVPQFGYQVYPIQKADAERNNDKSIPIATDMMQDLVFSIILTNSTAEGTFDLEEIRIVIPIGNPDYDRKEFKLFQSYSGPGPTMLSNLRFNAMHEYTDREVVVRLLPRSLPKEIQKGGERKLVRSIPWQKATEASFILRLVDVYPYKEPQDVTLTALEYYSQFKTPLSYPITAELK